jgi:hypothetical protein
MKIMILATAALVATAYGAFADDGSHPMSRVNEWDPGVVGSGVTGMIANEDLGRGISASATEETGRPVFAPEEGMLPEKVVTEPGDGSLL